MSIRHCFATTTSLFAFICLVEFETFVPSMYALITFVFVRIQMHTDNRLNANVNVAVAASAVVVFLFLFYFSHILFYGLLNLLCESKHPFSCEKVFKAFQCKSLRLVNRLRHSYDYYCWLFFFLFNFD